MKLPGPRTQGKFVTTNKYISRSFFHDLRECLKYIRMGQVTEYMSLLGETYTIGWTIDGHCITMEDLNVIYGPLSYGYAAGPIYFYAGPHKLLPNGKENYSLIQSTALNWGLDVILSHVNLEGYGILQKLDIPL